MADWAVTLIVNGKMYWLARVHPEWPAASALAGGVTLILFGVVLGIMQWMALRGRVYRAGWWIVISTTGWALTVALNTVPWAEFIVMSWLIPAAIEGAGMVWLLRRPAPAFPSAT